MKQPADSRSDKISRTGMRIRRATLDDLNSLVALENATFSADRLSPRQWRRHLVSDSVCVLVAADSQRVHAAALLLFRRNSRVARLYSIAVDAGARGLGLGAALLAASEEASRQRACTQLRLEVRRDNIAAQKLYLSRGYQLFATRPNYYEDGEDALRFARSLSGV
ncbi:MAG TPA: GNAT family N-acetyltransferase [Dokdonella sp.]|uniref:GNAT family N-acetyltransferase n=1 Tax=Dokdonella sp. TaxID=2291710 RepID=UPI002D7F1DCB|nr:GNAT family N-acetyltransferase [Dokdonella sp.]HET9031404.1 GNAT family N-acetyltransferase [Dokdonella sp.]